MKTLTLEQENKLLAGLAPEVPIQQFLHEHAKQPHQWLSTWKSLRNVTATILMLDAGLRVGEVVGLTYDDLYFELKPVKTLIVRKMIAKKQHQREIPLTERLRSILLCYYNYPPGFDFHLQQRPLISRTAQGGTLTTRSVERIITSAGLAALGFPVNPHMLRHTYATKLMKVTDIRTVQELLGHKHVSSTQIYTHVNDEDKRRAVADMGKINDSPAAGSTRR